MERSGTTATKAALGNASRDRPDDASGSGRGRPPIPYEDEQVRQGRLPLATGRPGSRRHRGWGDRGIRSGVDAACLPGDVPEALRPRHDMDIRGMVDALLYSAGQAVFGGGGPRRRYREANPSTISLPYICPMEETPRAGFDSRWQASETTETSSAQNAGTPETLRMTGLGVSLSASGSAETERGGFEPPRPVSRPNGLANRRFRPLSHLSTASKSAMSPYTSKTAKTESIVLENGPGSRDLGEFLDRRPEFNLR